ncbi:MAG: hypothetical protein ACXAEU_25475 [Candidatus Hodarchaeales archaeon]|jgi:hypothetical protein
MATKIINHTSFAEEFQKIAQNADPQLAELERLKQPTHASRKEINKEVLKQFAKNTLAIAAGTAVGHGAGQLALMGLKKHKLIDKIPPRLRTGIAVGTPVLGGAAFLLKGMMREEANRKLREAREKGLQSR